MTALTAAQLDAIADHPTETTREELLHLVAIARAALAWSERLDPEDEHRWHPLERDLYAATQGTP